METSTDLIEREYATKLAAQQTELDAHMAHTDEILKSVADAQEEWMKQVKE